MTEWAGFAELVVVRLEVGILVYFLAVNGFYAMLLFSSAIEMRQHLLATKNESRWRVLGSPFAPSITMLAPAHDEVSSIVGSVRALLALHYPNLEVIVVSDGSTDGTLEALVEHFELVRLPPVYRRVIPAQPVRAIYRSERYPNLLVMDKENGGRADALNAGLNLATGSLVCTMDADTLIEPDALQRMVRPFLDGGDVAAVGGTIRISNGSIVRDGRVAITRVPRRPLPGIQVVEYLRAFLFGRLGWNRMGGNLIISGAFGLFRRDDLIAIGGYLAETVGEDVELVIRLRRNGYETGAAKTIAFIPDPVAWTDAPETLATLGRQRDRWHRGLADVLWRHRKVCLNPKYGAMGLVVYPYYLVFELAAPIIEMLGLIAIALGLTMGFINLPFAILFFLVAYGIGTALTLLTLALETLSFHRYERFRDVSLLVVWGLLENIGYRQLTVVWRLRGLFHYLLGNTHWDIIEPQQSRARLSAARDTAMKE
jgi:cellulose synthase/poly-beta-1,6-N-acetylglucosamine synthase-like glycosyltransferase